MKCLLSALFCAYSLMSFVAFGAAAEDVPPPPYHTLSKPLISTFEELTKAVENLSDQLRALKGEKAVLLVGPTGAGKTTLFNFLTGNDLKLKKTNRGFVLESTGGATISHLNSETVFPNAGQVLGHNWTIIDCPGFKATGGAYVDVFNGILIQELTNHFTKVKIVMVMPEDSLTGRALEGTEAFNTLTTLFPAVSALKPTLSFILTKQRDMTAQSALGEIIESEAMLPKARELLQNLVDQKWMCHFPHPFTLRTLYGSGVEVVSHDIRNQILDTISSTSFSNPPQTNIVMSTSSQMALKDLCSHFHKEVGEFFSTSMAGIVKDACASLVDRHAQEVQALKDKASSDGVVSKADADSHYKKGKELAQKFSELSTLVDRIRDSQAQYFIEDLSKVLGSINIPTTQWQEGANKLSSLTFLTHLNPSLEITPAVWKNSLGQMRKTFCDFGTIQTSSERRQRTLGTFSRVVGEWEELSIRGGRILGILPKAEMRKKQEWSDGEVRTVESRSTITFPTQTITYPWGEESREDHETYRGEHG